ncbi:MAG: type II toxin-antitoxin system Phd/YefM family antitoxin [Deltaproteobacteria bacterium]|nr:type II toxin-antitoxin system Phd/YefM family antitoxin [Deltaproteobacteria bacterium]
MLEVIPATQVRKNFLPLIKKVGTELFKFIIAKQGKPIAVVLSYEEYNGMVETLRIIGQGTAAKDIESGLAELRRGETFRGKDMLGDE